MSTLFVRLFALLGLVATMTVSPLSASAQPMRPGPGGIGGPLQWQGNRAFWVDSSRRRHFVTDAQAQAWYRQRDPRWWQAHQRDWHGNRSKFARDWQRDHR